MKLETQSLMSREVGGGGRTGSSDLLGLGASNLDHREEDQERRTLGEKDRQARGEGGEKRSLCR